MSMRMYVLIGRTNHRVARKSWPPREGDPWLRQSGASYGREGLTRCELVIDKWACLYDDPVTRTRDGWTKPWPICKRCEKRGEG